MKKCQEWWNEEQSVESNKKFVAKYGELTTQEQVIEALVNTVWRAALERVLEQEYDYDGPTAYDWIREELEE